MKSAFLENRWYWWFCWPLLFMWILILTTGAPVWQAIALLFIVKNLAILYYGWKWRRDQDLVR